VSRIFHLLTGEFPPDRGGVGDYTHLLAHALAARGCEVHVWCPSVARPDRDGGVRVHRLPDVFGSASRRALGVAFAVQPGCVLLQYVPNVLGARGANVPFCLWLRRLGRRNVDVRVMFHEPYFYFAWEHPLRNLLAGTQRVMARVLLQASRIVYLSTAAWGRYLRPLAPRPTEMIVMPIPSTIAASADPDASRRWRARFGGAPIVGHFGTFGGHLAGELRHVLPAILERDERACVLCIGRGSDAFVVDFRNAHPKLASRIAATGPLSPAEVAAALGACDVLVQPYPDGVTTRRTSVMAGLASRVAVVTTDGFLTEPVWADSGAVLLAPASDSSAIAARAIELLGDRTQRAALAEAGLRAYLDHFAIDRTVDRLLAPTETADAGPEGRARTRSGPVS
jgi:glycosyltransferase involved in cell wall biosynthesis